MTMVEIQVNDQVASHKARIWPVPSAPNALLTMVHINIAVAEGPPLLFALLNAEQYATLPKASAIEWWTQRDGLYVLRELRGSGPFYLLASNPSDQPARLTGVIGGGKAL